MADGPDANESRPTRKVGLAHDELGLLNSFCTALRPSSHRRRKSADTDRIGECRLTLGSQPPSPVRDLIYGAAFPPITHSMDLDLGLEDDICRPPFLRAASRRSRRKRLPPASAETPLTPRFVEKLTRVHHIAAQELAEYDAMDARKACVAKREAGESKDSQEDPEEWEAFSPTSVKGFDHRTSRVVAFRQALREACAAFDNVDTRDLDAVEKARRDLQLSITELESRAPGFVRDATKEDYANFMRRINRWNLAEQLPREVLLECLSWLSVTDLSTFGTTCREYYKVSCMNVLWIPIYMSRYQDVLCYNDNLEGRLRGILDDGTPHTDGKEEEDDLYEKTTNAGLRRIGDLSPFESDTERLSSTSMPGNICPRASDFQRRHEIESIVSSIRPVNQPFDHRSRDMHDVSRVSVDVLPLAALQPYVAQGVVKDMLKNRHCVPYIGDQVEVSWKGKFRLEGNAEAYQGRAWWCANIVDIESDELEDDEGNGEITVATLQMFTSSMASRVKVHYAGWDPRWDEWIERHRLRRAGPIPPSYSRTDVVQTQDPAAVEESVNTDLAIHEGVNVESHVAAEEEQLIPNPRDRRDCLRIRPGDQVEVWCCGERVPGAWLESTVKEVFHSGQLIPRLKDWINVGCMIQPHAAARRDDDAPEGRDLWVRRHRVRLARKEPVPQVPRRRSSSGSSLEEHLGQPERQVRSPWFGMLQHGASPLRRRVSDPPRNGNAGASVVPVHGIEFDHLQPPRLAADRRRDFASVRATRMRVMRDPMEQRDERLLVRTLYGPLREPPVEMVPEVIEIRRNAFSDTNIVPDRTPPPERRSTGSRRHVWRWLH